MVSYDSLNFDLYLDDPIPNEIKKAPSSRKRSWLLSHIEGMLKK